jgi:DNA-binding transcriptional ArsR family regulator
MSTSRVSNMNFEDLIPYCIFPNSFIRNGKIPAQQRVLFEILCTFDHMDKNKNRKGWCDPNLDTLADYMGLSIRSVQTHLKRLVEAGMVTVVYRNNSLQNKRSSIYILNILPGISEFDRKRIAATRNIDIKHAISGLNNIKVQTAKGTQLISEKEFDLEYLVTGNPANGEIIDGEIATPEDIISKEEEVNDGEESEVNYSKATEEYKQNTTTSNGVHNRPKQNTTNTNTEQVDEEIEISFTKSNIKVKKEPKQLNDYQLANWNNEDAIVRIQVGNYEGLKPIDYCMYFKHKYELQYPGEHYIVDRTKDLAQIRNKLKDLEPELVINLIEYFVANYQRLFYNNEYRRPKIYQLGIAWLLNKLMENYYYKEKNKVEEPIQVRKDDNTVKRQVF